jgi:hypothetical protein
MVCSIVWARRHEFDLRTEDEMISNQVQERTNINRDSTLLIELTLFGAFRCLTLYIDHILNHFDQLLDRAQLLLLVPSHTARFEQRQALRYLLLDAILVLLDWYTSKI